MAEPSISQPNVRESQEALQEEQVHRLQRDVDADIVFIIERSKNKNVVCYSAKRANAGESKLDETEPMVAYWLDIDPEYVAKARAAGKMDDRVDLNVFENQFAYGLAAEPAGGRPGAYEVHLVALPSRTLELYLKDDGKAAARMVISGRACNMFKIYVDSTDRWVGPPKVNWVELHGVDLETGEHLVERMHP